jgi:DNA-binding NarL/FixJ family response regulator
MITVTRPRLVIADDHKILVESLRTMLAKRFEIAGTAHDGDSLLALLAQTPADCLLLDLSMPGRSGLELLPEIRQRYPKMKVLVVTMHVERILADAVMLAGASGFIPKDSGMEELSEAIRAVLAGRSWVSPRVPPAAPVPIEEETPRGLAALTPRQMEILRLIGQGRSSADIAEDLGVSVHTVTFHRTRIRQLLGIPNEWGLSRLALLLQVGTPAPAPADEPDEPGAEPPAGDWPGPGETPKLRLI